jgi:hypothetical protein
MRSKPRPRLLSFDGPLRIANGLQGVQGAGEDFLARRWEPMDTDKIKMVKGPATFEIQNGRAKIFGSQMGTDGHR